jgi:hypothetical protein
MAELPGACELAGVGALGRIAAAAAPPLAILLISETIDVRPFLHKHAEHAEYNRSLVLSKHQEKFSGW